MNWLVGDLNYERYYDLLSEMEDAIMTDARAELAAVLRSVCMGQDFTATVDQLVEDLVEALSTRPDGSRSAGWLIQNYGDTRVYRVEEFDHNDGGFQAYIADEEQ